MVDELEYQGEPWIRELGSVSGQTFKCEHLELIGVTAATCPICGLLKPEDEEMTSHE